MGIILLAAIADSEEKDERMVLGILGRAEPSENEVMTALGTEARFLPQDCQKTIHE